MALWSVVGLAFSGWGSTESGLRCAWSGKKLFKHTPNQAGCDRGAGATSSGGSSTSSIAITSMIFSLIPTPNSVSPGLESDKLLAMEQWCGPVLRVGGDVVVVLCKRDELIPAAARSGASVSNPRRKGGHGSVVYQPILWPSPFDCSDQTSVRTDCECPARDAAGSGPP